MNSLANSIIRFYQLATSTIPSPVNSPSTLSRPHSQDQRLSPTLPLQFGMHYIHGADTPERSFPASGANTAISNTNVFSVMSLYGTESTPWNDALYSKVENLPTADQLSLPLRPLPGSLDTIYSDTDLVESSRTDKHSFRKFIRSPNKWFRSLSSKNVPNEIDTLGSALMKELNVITLDSPGNLVSEFGSLVADNDEQRDQSFKTDADNNSTDGIGNPLSLYPDYVDYWLGTAAAEYSGINHGEEEGDYDDDDDDNGLHGYENHTSHGSSGCLVPKDPPLIYADRNSGEVQTPSMFHEMMNPDRNEDDDGENYNFGTLKRNSTLRRLTTKTKEMLKQWSPHHSLPSADEEKENQDPGLSLPRRSLSLRGLSSLSLKRSISFRGWSRHKKSHVWDYDDECDNDSIPGANLMRLFDDPEFKRRLEEGHVVERKPYEFDKVDENESSLVTRYEDSTIGYKSVADGFNVQVAKSTSNVLTDRKIENNMNLQLSNSDHQRHEKVNRRESGENFFSVLRAKTIRRAHSIREATRAARAAMLSYEAHH